MPNTSAIQTTTVGSYPVPDWLQALPSEQGLSGTTYAKPVSICPPTATCTASTSTT